MITQEYLKSILNYNKLNGIAKHSFNHLGDSWTMWDMWRATIDPYDCEEPNKTEW